MLIDRKNTVFYSTIKDLSVTDISRVSQDGQMRRCRTFEIGRRKEHESISFLH